MKKNKRHLYKRLPKYALGTMKPTDLGYQRGMIGSSAKFDTEQNMSLEPETQAVRKSALPNALGYIAQQTPYITENLKSYNQVQQTGANAVTNVTQPMQTTLNAATQTMGNLGLATTPLYQIKSFAQTPLSLSGSTASGVSSGLSASLSSGTGDLGSSMASTGFAGLGEKSGATFFGNASGEAAKNAGKSVLGNIASKALAGVGSAIGLYTMGNQIAGFGDHRSASDMLANVGRQHITTDMGNSYTNYNGINAGQELAYERANARSKQLGFGMNSIGTGASIGSFFGPVGAGIGAAAGLLLGGLGSLFGWGDNSDEIERITKLTNDNIAMYNRQQEAVAKSKDVAAEFSDRQGVSAAATGKGAYQSMDKFLPMFKNKTHGKDVEVLQGSDGPKIGIATSMGEKGEGAYNFETRQGSIIEGFEKGKGDAQPLYHTDGDSTVIFSKKLGFADIANPYILDTQRNWNIINNMKGDAQTQQVQKAVATAKIEKNDMKLREINNAQSAFKQQMEMKKYKNGKLPGFWRGTDYLMSAIPHLAALGSSWNQYNRAKYADMPDYPNIVDSEANTNAIRIFGERKYNVDPILDNIHKNYRQYLYNISHSGASAGQQAMERANAFIKKNEAQTQALTQADEINNRYTADYANALANYGKMMTEMMTNNNYARAAFKQQQNAAKEGWMAQYQKNGLTALADLASDVMGVRQFNRSEDYQNKMLELYGTQVKNDNINAQAALANAEQARLDREAAYRKVIKDAAEKTHPMFANYSPFRPDGVWNAFGDPVFNYKLSYPQFDQKYIKYAKPVGYKDGKGGFVSRGNNLGSYVEEIQPSNILGIGGSDEYSTKMITADGDTIYQNPGVFSRDVVRKKGGPASKEYIKAKQKHERLLKNATPSYNIGMDQLLRMFGF